MSSPASRAVPAAGSPSASMEERPDNRLGILCMILGMSLFTLNDAMGKWLVEIYPVPMILAIRSAASLLILAPLIMRAGPLRVLRTDKPIAHLVRVALMIAEVALFYISVRVLPLADVLTIYMAAPLLVTALSVPLLGEKVGPRRWCAIAVGFAGVLMVLRPTGDILNFGALAALGGSFTFALMLISTRSLRGTGGLTLLVFQTLGVGAAGAIAVPFYWTLPTWPHLGLLGILGVVALAAHALVNQSLKLSPAAVVVPYQYTSLVWALALGWIIWGDVPDPWVAAGAALIVASGLFVFHREQRLAAAPELNSPELNSPELSSEAGAASPGRRSPDR
ncbi:DMT family transporter [Skermanella mucosa]|uniref:DMT family transporter n=1 Tax=Skermanella mucosa TaxID=1789672 RepID=UPI001E2E46FF|nr:DMT family transporter [Skermanella mucosa]UEM23302.1 DMT family transporter [Skermanella mucosa]